MASIRGQRRLDRIDQALEPMVAELDEDSRRRVTGALALCVGAEAFFVLSDVCGLSRDEIGETLRWATTALLASAAKDARGERSRPS